MDFSLFCQGRFPNEFLTEKNMQDLAMAGKVCAVTDQLINYLILIIRPMELIIWRQISFIFRHERHWSGTFGNELVQWTTTIAIVTVACTYSNIYFWDTLKGESNARVPERKMET